MSTTPQYPVMIGLISQSSMREGIDKCPRFGLFEPVYDIDEIPYLAQGSDGHVTRYVKLQPRAVERGLLKRPTGFPGPRVGDIVSVAIVYERQGKADAFFGPWDEVATFACGQMCPELCLQMRRHPLEGYNLARFLTEDVGRYVQHAIGGGGFDFEAKAAELREFARIRDEIRAAHPGWGHVPQPAFPRAPRKIDPTLN